VLGGKGGLAEVAQETVAILDEMIGGADEQHRLRRHQHCGGEDCRPGIAPLRLDDDLGIATDLLELLTHEEAVRLDRHDDRTIEDILGSHPQHGLLQARGRVQDSEELLRAAVAGDRPEPGTAATAQDHRDRSALCTCFRSVHDPRLDGRGPAVNSRVGIGLELTLPPAARLTHDTR
jgi:hypothetical protein